MVALPHSLSSLFIVTFNSAIFFHTQGCGGNCCHSNFTPSLSHCYYTNVWKSTLCVLSTNQITIHRFILQVVFNFKLKVHSSKYGSRRSRNSLSMSLIFIVNNGRAARCVNFVFLVFSHSSVLLFDRQEKLWLSAGLGLQIAECLLFTESLHEIWATREFNF